MRSVTKSRKPKLLGTDEFWEYAGTCQHCGARQNFAGSTLIPWREFKGILLRIYPSFPWFFSECLGCGNEAVFQLTAMSARPEGEGR